jgi:hypothetical protein
MPYVISYKSRSIYKVKKNSSTERRKFKTKAAAKRHLHHVHSHYSPKHGHYSSYKRRRRR